MTDTTKAQQTFGGKPRDELPDSAFVDEDARAFPIATAQDVRDAVSSWGRYKGKLTFPEFKEKLVALAKKKGLADALPEAWGATKSEPLPFDPFAAEEPPPPLVEIKAGARHSASDMAILKAMHGDQAAYFRGRAEAAEAHAAKMADYLKALGFEPMEADTPDEATPDEALNGEPALKALDLLTRHELVCAAIEDALEELGALDDDHEMSVYVRPIVATKCDEDDGPEIYVYDDHAVARLPTGDWKIPYEIEAGEVVLGDPDEWERVEIEWAPVEGAGPITEEGEEEPATKYAIKSVLTDDGEELLTYPGESVKALGDGWVGGYLVRFGDPATDPGDLSAFRDIFTKETDFGGVKSVATSASLVWTHHRMLPGIGKQRLTNDAEIGIDDEGVFIKHLLDLRNTYEAKLYQMAQAQRLGWSSGTAPHLVDRKALPDGRHVVTLWPLGADASYTPTPAGGFAVNTASVKSFLDLFDTSPEATDPEPARPDGAEADDGAARRLAVELTLLELEETTP